MANGYRYFSTAVAAEGGAGEVIPRKLEFTGRPGSRAPHHWLLRDGARVSTLDLFGDGFVLLAAEQGEAWTGAAEQAAKALNVPLTAHRIGAELTDPDGGWQQGCGLDSDGALLVRPDGFVAWRARSGSADPEQTLHDALSTILSGTV